MLRRELLRLLTTVPLISQNGGVFTSTSWYLDNYRGFEIYWYGWIKLYNMHAVVGSWIARNPEKRGWHVYSAYPGTTDKEQEGYMMDIAIRKNQEVPMPWTTDAELEGYKRNAYDRLIKYIDEHYYELVK